MSYLVGICKFTENKHIVNADISCCVYFMVSKLWFLIWSFISVEQVSLYNLEHHSRLRVTEANGLFLFPSSDVSQPSITPIPKPANQPTNPKQK